MIMAVFQTMKRHLVNMITGMLKLERPSEDPCMSAPGSPLQSAGRWM